MKRLSMAALGILAIALSAFAEPAKVSKNDVMREKPFSNSKAVMSLKTGQVADIQKREGSWYLVNVSGKTGWAPMLSVRRTKSVAPASSGRLSGTATGRSATGSVVSTTGIRGLNEESLKTAAFDEKAVAAAEKNRVPAAAVDSFALAGGLKARAVPALAGTTAKGGR